MDHKQSGKLARVEHFGNRLLGAAIPYLVIGFVASVIVLIAAAAARLGL